MKNKAYSMDIANAINTFLKEDDWHYSFDEQRGVFKFGLNLKSKLKKVNYLIHVKEDEYIVYAISPIGADEDDETMMAAIAEFVCRANYGLKNGNFELDMRDGEVRFKSFVDCEDIMPSVEVIRNSIHCPAAMFKQYGDGIIDIIFGNASAKDAIARCEKSPMDELRSILGDDFDEGADIEAMLTRLAERLGIDTSELGADEAQPPIADSVAEVRTDLFGLKGGSN